MTNESTRPKQLFEVIWSDPSGNEMKIKELDRIVEDPNDSLGNLLVETHCYGHVVKEDMEAILLSYFTDASGLVKFKTIARPLTCEPIISYYRNDKVNLLDYYEQNRPVGKKRRLVEVAWFGSGTKWTNLSEIGEILGNPLTELLPINYSYGAVFSEDEDVVVLKHYENELGWREIQAIPRGVIQKITPFYQSGRTNSTILSTSVMPAESGEDNGGGGLIVSDEDLAAATEQVLGQEGVNLT